MLLDEWICITCFLYVEICVIIVLITPKFGASKWCKLYRSGFFWELPYMSVMYFYFIIGIISLFLFDAALDIIKYSGLNEEKDTTAVLNRNINLFNAKLNFYITGFALLLACVIRRLVIMTNLQSDLMDESSDIFMEAKAATVVAKRTMNIYRMQMRDDADKFASMHLQLRTHQVLLGNCEQENGRLQDEIEEWKTKYKNLRPKDENCTDNSSEE